MTETILHHGKDIETELKRLASEIIADGAEPPVLVGIHRHGVPLARRLADMIEAAGHTRPELGAIDITLYRDDLDSRALPQVHGSEIPFDIEDRRVVLVDDVLFTGRTVRAALAVLADYGRPQRIQLCALVDRGHRELPICADFVGMKLKTERTDHVRVALMEAGAGEDAVILQQQ